MLDLPSVTALVMVLAIEWRPEEIIGDKATWTFRVPEAHTALRLLGSVVGILAIYVKDYRLELDGVKFSAIAAALTALAKLAHARAEANMRDTRKIDNLKQMEAVPDTLVLLGGVVALVIVTAIDETGPRITFMPSVAPITFIVSTIAGGVALEQNGHIFRRMLNLHAAAECPVGFLDRTRLGRALTSIAFVHAALVGSSVFSSSGLTISIWQYLGFLLATVASLTWEDLASAANIFQYRIRTCCTSESSATSEVMEQESLMLESMTLKTPEPQSANIMCNASSWVTSLILLISLVSGPIVIIPECVYPSESTTVPFWDRFETSLRGPRALDIVLARYDESAQQVVADLNALAMLPQIAPLRPKTIIYNKAEDANTSSWAADIDDLVVPGLQVTVQGSLNAGREAETFLTHIIDNWNNLADHTIFSQAAAHEVPALRRRVQDYFVPETGFLALSIVGRICRDCNTCKDKSGWDEQGDVLEDIWSRANNGSECRDLILAYRGQFVVSASRIRSNSKEMYEYLREQLVNPESDQHKMPYLDQNWMAGREDSLEAPHFGYTIERMWSAIFHCSDPRIAYECPSVTSGLLGNRMPLGSCQCLDMLDGDREKRPKVNTTVAFSDIYASVH
ncbi:hypothetical protein B0A50_05989 [Salinomyces thailandicus]|uniref:Uncharacterized protein n=1 Tax=Salinomyces thailandicus TaxID=706561 RepID=A0A4U0TR35_9PEZI|nr:hypothetical protein B0A50_05989 [Salinomyces thailandica]